MEIRSQTLDAPYGDSFINCEVMIVVSDDMGGSIFVTYVKVDFIKNTIFKNKIEKASESGLIEADTDFRKFYNIPPEIGTGSKLLTATDYINTVGLGEWGKKDQHGNDQ